MKTRFGLVLVGPAGEYSGATLPGLGSNWNSTSFCRALVKLNFLGSHGWQTCRGGARQCHLGECKQCWVFLDPDSTHNEERAGGRTMPPHVQCLLLKR